MKAFFERQVELLIKVLDTVLDNPLFVLKGGTAINFFHSNLPRLSVDIDLTYIKINSRSDFLNDTNNFWAALKTKLLRKHQLNMHLHHTKEGHPIYMRIASARAEIKVEVNHVLRGTIYPLSQAQICEMAKIRYETKIKTKTLSFEEIYAGKFCAALDRQHPRDLFDTHIFFENHSITEKLKKALLVYLISCNRPIAELINPHLLDQRSVYEDEFLGMTQREITYKQLIEAREMLIIAIDKAFTSQDREFLLSFKKGQPNFEYLEISNIADMPAIKWKLQNIAKIEPKKHAQLVDTLKEKLGF